MAVGAVQVFDPVVGALVLIVDADAPLGVGRKEFRERVGLLRPLGALAVAECALVGKGALALVRAVAHAVGREVHVAVALVPPVPLVHIVREVGVVPGDDQRLLGDLLLAANVRDQRLGLRVQVVLADVLPDLDVLAVGSDLRARGEKV